MTGFYTDYLLIGGGVAATSAAAELRHQGFDGTITLASRELEAPYHRPPITKQLLGPKAEAHEIEVYPASWWAEQNIELLTRASVIDLNPSAHIVTLADKRFLRYGQALLATGATVRRLGIEGSDLEGIHYLRTPANARKVRLAANEAQHIVLVGGSFIAVEAAASLSAGGHRCTLVMQEERPLERTFGAIVAGYVESLLGQHGVELIGGADVVAFTGDQLVSGVKTADGRLIKGDLIIVGAGAIPDAKLGAKAGLEIGPTGGIRCDRQLRTSAEDIYAAGDVCEYDSVVHGRTIRVEHEEHAAAQGRTAAQNMLGKGVDHTEVPFFWTDLADWSTLQYVGAAQNWDEEQVTGSVAHGNFTVWYLNSGRLVAALTAGRSEDLDVARRLISSGDTASRILPWSPV